MPDTNAWLIGVLSTLSAAISIMWRHAVAESRRKDILIDRLLTRLRSRNEDES